MAEIVREITPLNSQDLFLLQNNYEAKFDYPIHFHSDYELNLVCNTSGQRIVGDSVEYFDDVDLIFIGSNLPHVWKATTTEQTHVITIQFDSQITESFLLNKNLFLPIKNMLMRSSQGLDFSPDVKNRVKDRIILLSQSIGFNSSLEFFSILYELATSQGQRCLSSTSYDISKVIRESKSRRIAKVCEFIEAHYNREIKLIEVCAMVGMSESAFSHFFKKRTNCNFITYLNEVRIGHATKLLLETTHSISEIGYMCGFSNISYFNRIFKKLKDQTPSEYKISVQNMLTKY